MIQIRLNSGISAITILKFFSIKRVAKAAEKVNLGFEWDSGLAVISARGVTMRNYLKINLDSDAGVNSWKKIEGFVERWMQAKKQRYHSSFDSGL